MSEYHVGCGLAGIYAGTLKKNGKEWLHKSDVTDEALEAVRDWLFMEHETKKTNGYSWKLKNGGHIKLMLQITNGGDEKWKNRVLLAITSQMTSIV